MLEFPEVWLPGNRFTFNLIARWWKRLQFCCQMAEYLKVGCQIADLPSVWLPEGKVNCSLVASWKSNLQFDC